MQTISVQTTQNVVIKYPVASVGDRIGAFIIDFTIIIMYIFIVSFIYDYFNLQSAAIVIFTIFLPLALYHLAFEVLMDGQSPGKRIVRIKVVRTDGAPPTLGNYLIRWLLRFVDILLSSVFGLPGAIAVITIAAGGRGQRLGDMAAGTAVVKLVQPSETTASELFAPLKEDQQAGYQPVFPQSTLLTDEHVEIIRQALEVYRNTGNDKPLLAVTEKVKQITGIQSDLPPVKMLYMLLDDYARLTSR
ncbi:MAG: RDD family protein [Cyclobacteriaceae bacterium]|nr:RDD family protein [Cyclobacteriaceae bacterium]MDW8330963.1 RDD family protein [Cyclobacteriaceae bacterium]